MTVSTAEKPQMRATHLLGKILRAWRTGKRRVWLEGGTWASKTYTTIQFLKLIAENNPEPLTISVVSETIPHLKRGAIRDFISIMGDDLLEKQWNKTDFIYHFPSGTVLEFFSADMPSKLRGGRRDVLFINEANNVSYDSYRELDMRTRLFTVADWNPVSEFWFHENKLGDETDSDYLHLTYQDARAVVPESVIADIESYQDKDPNWWRVYGLGLIGKIEGLVYPNFEQVDELPAEPQFYGLDFGSLADPTVCTAHVIQGDNLYSRELFYVHDAEITNQKISMMLRMNGVNPRVPIFPDPDEPKSFTELRQLGWTVGETVKGKGSVEFGIKAVNNYYQHWTKDSTNCIKEQRNYRYLEDKNGNLTDNTTHKWSHGMDSRRYGVASYQPQRAVGHSKPVKYGVRMVR